MPGRYFFSSQGWLKNVAPHEPGLVGDRRLDQRAHPAPAHRARADQRTSTTTLAVSPGTSAATVRAVCRPRGRCSSSAADLEPEQLGGRLCLLARGNLELRRPSRRARPAHRRVEQLARVKVLVGGEGAHARIVAARGGRSRQLSGLAATTRPAGRRRRARLDAVGHQPATRAVSGAPSPAMQVTSSASSESCSSTSRSVASGPPQATSSSSTKPTASPAAKRPCRRRGRRGPRHRCARARARRASPRRWPRRRGRASSASAAASPACWERDLTTLTCLSESSRRARRP